MSCSLYVNSSEFDKITISHNMLGLLVILSLAVAGVRSFSCPEYDFITRHQDVANVNRFFMCLNGNINILNCEEGLYFDSITERCESLEWLAKAIVCDPNVDSYFPHEIYCSKYYHCVHGELIVQNCPEGTEFNPTLNLCDWPSASGCSSKTTDSPLVNTTTPVPTTMSPNTTINFTMTATPTDYPPTANTTLETNTTTAANTTIMDSTSEQPTTINPPSICPQNSSTITIVADKDDCQKFYICFNGNASPYQCDDGEEFNSDSLVCEPISENGCTASKTTTYSPITNTTVTDQTTENPTSQQPSPICDPNDNTLNIVPDPEDCFIFYVCFMGIPTEYTCDKTLNLEFDPVSKKCVEISDTGCTASKNNTTMTSY